jgi:hypothetical protein
MLSAFNIFTWIETNIPHDKAIHFIMGVLIYAMFTYWFGWKAIFFVMAAGAAKELYDVFHLKIDADVFDFLATVLGGCFCLFCSWVGL